MFLTLSQKKVISPRRKGSISVLIKTQIRSGMRYLPKALIKTLTKAEDLVSRGTVPTCSARFTLRHMEINRNIRALMLLPVSLNHFYYVFLEKPFLWTSLLVEFHSYYRK